MVPNTETEKIAEKLMRRVRGYVRLLKKLKTRQFILAVTVGVLSMLLLIVGARSGLSGWSE